MPKSTKNNIQINASIWNQHRTDITVHKDVKVINAGVILDYGEDSEVFIPFGSGRVHEVFCNTRAVLEMDLI